jgi:hypothetical protein
MYLVVARNKEQKNWDFWVYSTTGIDIEDAKEKIEEAREIYDEVCVAFPWSNHPGAEYFRNSVEESHTEVLNVLKSFTTE